MILNSSKVVLVIKGSLDFDKIYKGTTLIWLKIKDIISSCFSSGKWLGSKKWVNNDTWKAN